MVRFLSRSVGRYRRTDSITAPGTPIRLTADTFCYPEVAQTHSHLRVRGCSSSVLAMSALTPRNGVFLPPVTRQTRCTQKAILSSLIWREGSHPRELSVRKQRIRTLGMP